MPKLIDAIEDGFFDLIDQGSDTKSRVGHTVQRVAKLKKDGVSKRTIACHLTDNSAAGNEYTVADVDALLKVHQDCETRVPLTVKATKALSRDQKRHGRRAPDDAGQGVLA
ncbi:hypothetical protein N7645_15195 [Pseudomonas juntendi]|uniref:hypothetical protein n=1 Tax=Pseudomonas TaxID=286 RepID=UPI0012AE28CE|nr:MULTISPECIES: hypothetical protein [Pseudomonas]MDG9918234.1 hypothetical protein [Pseudomonas juntendi]MDH0507682.1 hypothetical protein [Pseudomonas juntendi]MDH1044836.1 hypothetical protein [Pseudomonas juntendi]MRT62349.1 hypothetical protein [Pseudomonas sp. CAH-1]